MVYPMLTDNFNLNVLNDNFLELYNQINISYLENLTSSNLGTVSWNRVNKKCKTCQYSLASNSGNWNADTPYKIATIPIGFRPLYEIDKTIFLRKDIQSFLYIGTNGDVVLTPRSAINNLSIAITETYII